MLEMKALFDTDPWKLVDMLEKIGIFDNLGGRRGGAGLKKLGEFLLLRLMMQYGSI